ncbi:hypothetical protein ACFV6E_23105 [Streptomyces sp. NPDC059785]|uniref:hypothetical protein n=1 Tax=Streptomyces sp. NPDC059785 TaxID=3346945 RepID=UPI00364BAB2D
MIEHATHRVRVLGTTAHATVRPDVGQQDGRRRRSKDHAKPVEVGSPLLPVCRVAPGRGRPGVLTDDAGKGFFRERARLVGDGGQGCPGAAECADRLAAWSMRRNQRGSGDRFFCLHELLP